MEIDCSCGASTAILINDSRESGLGAAYRELAKASRADAKPLPNVYASLILPASTLAQAESSLTSHIRSDALVRMLHYGEHWDGDIEDDSLVHGYDLLVNTINDESTHVLPNTPSHNLDEDVLSFDMMSLTSVLVIFVPFPLVCESSADGEAVRRELYRFLRKVGTASSKEPCVVKLVRCIQSKSVKWEVPKLRIAANDDLEEAECPRLGWDKVLQDWETLSQTPFGDDLPPCTCSPKAENEALYLTWSSLALDWSNDKTFSPAIGDSLIAGVGALKAALNPKKAKSADSDRPVRQCCQIV